MLCLAVIGQDDGDILIGQDSVSEGAGEYMNEYLIAGSNLSKIREQSGRGASGVSCNDAVR